MTRALQSTPFQNSGGFPERDGGGGEGRTEEILVSNIGYQATRQIGKYINTNPNNLKRQILFCHCTNPDFRCTLSASSLPDTMSLLPGDLAPDFTLDSVLDGMVEKVVIVLVQIFIIITIILIIIAIVQVTLSSFRGQYVALMFYPVDFGEENHKYDDDDEDDVRLRDHH